MKCKQSVKKNKKIKKKLSEKMQKRNDTNQLVEVFPFSKIKQKRE